MAILLVRAVDDRVVKAWPVPLPHERGDIFEIRPDWKFGGGLFGCGWNQDVYPGPIRCRRTTYWVHVPQLCESRVELQSAQAAYDEPEWLVPQRPDHWERTKPKPKTAWVRGCWLDLDALEYRHQLSLQQTGHCWLSLAEAQAVFHSMTAEADSDLSRM